ncbi:MAG: hypothetical protein GY757_40275 [bacterium]|nr:hypothetical protein [bacterium]
MNTGVAYNEGTAMKETGRVQHNLRATKPDNPPFARVRKTIDHRSGEIGETVRKPTGEAR